MSQWANCSASITNVDESILKEAAKKMGYGIDTNQKKVSMSYGRNDTNSAKVDGVFTRGDKAYQIGFVKNGKDGLEIVGDFWQTACDAEEFTGTLGQLYREIEIQQRAEMMGYTVDSVTTNAQGDTVIEVYAW